LIIKKHQVT